MRPGGLVHGHIFNTRRFSVRLWGRTNLFRVCCGNKALLQPCPNSNTTSSQKINMKRQSSRYFRLTHFSYFSVFLTCRYLRTDCLETFCILAEGIEVAVFNFCRRDRSDTCSLRVLPTGDSGKPAQQPRLRGFCLAILRSTVSGTDL